MPRSRRKSRKAPIILCVLCTLLVVCQFFAEDVVDRVRIPAFLWFLRDFKPLQSAEFYTQDALARYFGTRAKVRPELVFLAIDRDSITLDQFDQAEIDASPALQQMQQGWPWPRTVYPLILDRLFGAGAKVVAMDLMFPTPRDGDEAFRAALDKYRDKFVFGVNFVQESRENGGSRTLQFPTEELVRQSAPMDGRLGYVNFWPDGDGVIRRVFYTQTMSALTGDAPEPGEEVYDSLVARILQKSGNASAIPPAGPHRIRFAGYSGQFPIKSVCDLFDAKKWNSPEYDGGKFFQGKIVLIGPEGNFMKDQVRTPFGVMGGPEMHLNAINAALDGAFIRELPPFSMYIFILLAGVAAWLLCEGVRSPLLRLAYSGGVMLAWVVIAQTAYNPPALLVYTFNPLVSLCFSVVCCSTWDFFQEQRDKALIRRKFERYVSKQVVGEIVDNPTSFINTLGGAGKQVAILFTDLRGFTSMTEKAEDKHALVAQLNEYFDVMVEPILATNGALDKYIGDAIMAVWGSIQSRGPAQDVRSAIITTLKMRESLPKLNKQWQEMGKESYAMGMGVNYGEVVVGELGSKLQMNFTVIGDAVNLASRIEGVTKEYGVDLLVGEEAAVLAKEFFWMQTAGLVRVKGRNQPVKLFYVIDERAGDPDPKREEYLRTYEEGIALYLKGDFAAAGSKFQKALELHPPDALAKVYIERCAILAKDPLPPDWDGVFVMKGK
jgi:adenylate cyclase